MVYRIYVGGLNPSIEKHDLTELFDRYGKPMIWVARSPPGFAFVEIEDKRDAEDAIRDLDGTEFRGVRLKMEFAKDSSVRKGPVDRSFSDNRSRYSDYNDRYGDSYHSSSHSHSRYDDRGYGGYSSYGYDDRDRDRYYGDRDGDRYSSRYDDRGYDRDRDRDRYSSRYDDRSSSSRYDDRRYPSYHEDRRVGPMINGEVKCFNCNQIGHYARDCPKEKNQGECYTCGKPGHQSRDCPEKAPYRNGASSSSTRRSRSRSPRRDDRDRRSRSPEKRRSSSPRRDTNGTSTSDAALPAQ